MAKPRYVLMSLIFSVISLVQAFSAQIYVSPATGPGISVSDLANVTELIRNSATQVKGNRTVTQESDAEVILKPVLMRLGSEYILSLTKIQNQQEFSGRLKADRMDSMDRIAARLTQSVLKDEQPEPVGAESIETAHEKRQATNRTYFGLGGVSFGQLNTSGIGYSFALAEAFDLGSVSIKILGEFDVQGTAFFTNVGGGLSYFFSTSNYSPYVSGDFGLGVAKIDGGSWVQGASVFGFVFGFGGGVELFRNASINMDIGLRAAFLMNQNGLGLPSAYTLRLGLYF